MTNADNTANSVRVNTSRKVAQMVPAAASAAQTADSGKIAQGFEQRDDAIGK